MKEKIVLIGCGGHMKVVVDSIEAAGKYEIVGLVDKVKNQDNKYREYSVIGDDDSLQEIYDSNVKNAFLCMGFLGEGTVRNELYEKCKKIGFAFPSIIDPSAVVASDVQIGDGVFVAKKAVLSSECIVERMAIINVAAVIDHECVVGEFSHVSAGSIMCGGSKVGKNSFVGAGVTILPQVCIGNNVIIGSGTVVRKNIADGKLVVGEKQKNIELQR